MSTPSHLLAGFTVLTLTQRWWGAGLTDSQTTWFLLFGILLSVAIDLDTLWSSGFLQNHHQQFTHWPLTWLIVTAVLALIGLLTHLSFLVNLSLVIFISATTHFTLDLFAVTSGIPLLAPFSRHEYAFTRLHEPFTSHVERTHFVLTHPWIIYREVLIIAAGLLFFITRSGNLLAQKLSLEHLPFLK